MAVREPERLPLFFVVVFFCVEDAMLLSFEVPISFVYRRCGATGLCHKIFGFAEALLFPKRLGRACPLQGPALRQTLAPLPPRTCSAHQRQVTSAQVSAPARSGPLPSSNTRTSRTCLYRRSSSAGGYRYSPPRRPPPLPPDTRECPIR